MKKIAVLFSGKGSNFAYVVEALHLDGCEVVVALTNNPLAGGIEIAHKHGIALEVVDSKSFAKREDFDARIVDILSKYSPDLTVLAGFMRILTPVFTSQIKAINLHPSLLPRYKGLDAIQKSYEDEFSEGGVSIHHVSSELDGGKIVLQKRICKAGLSFEDYDTKIRQIEKEVLVEAIKQVFQEENKHENI